MNDSVTTADRPAHVPEVAYYAFDIFRDPGLLEEPHLRALELHSDAPPVFWTPFNGGHWIALRFRDAHHIARHPETFSSELIPPELKQAMMDAMPEGTPRQPQLTPLMMDPPEHTRYRLPLQRAFAPKTVAALQSDIERQAHELVDAVIADGGCDVIPAIAEQLPVRVFLRMMGLPAERLAEFRQLAREVFEPSEFDPKVYGRRIRNIVDAMSGVIAQRRESPRDDLISMLWSLEVDGEPVSPELMEDYAALLFLAGLDTVVNAIGFGVRHLATDMELQDTLGASPELIGEATEELLRRYTFTVPVRRVTQDTHVGGQLLKAGDRVMLYLPAADLDPEEFPDPARFDLARDNKAHMLFGAGPHRCLGSHLARLELQTLYRVLLERLPRFRLDPERPVRISAGQNLSISSLPLRWD